jgi:excisionase family DNA binding protein
MKSIIILTEESLEGILKGQKEIIAKINELQGLKRDTEYLTTQEFMQRVKIGRSKFDQLIMSNEIKYIRKQRKIYIPETEVARYFEEE